MNELYPIVGYEGLYSVTKDGKVWSYAKGTYPSRWLTPILDSTGYMRVTLTRNGIAKIIHIHRILAINFIPNPENLPQVNHINGIKNDNRLENLEWVTVQQNSIHARAILGKCKSTEKQRQVASYWGKKNAKPIMQYSMAGEFIKLFDSSNEAALELGTCRTGITACLSGRRASAGGFKWKFGEGYSSRTK